VITLPAKTQEIIEKRLLQSVLLCIITTYTDRLLGTVDNVHYLATHDLSYDYGATATQKYFAAHITGISPFKQELSHLTVPGRNAIALTDEVTVLFANTPRDGTDTLLYDSLQQEQLLGADIEIAELPLAYSEHYMAWNLTGDDHTVQFRGRITNAGNISDTFELTAESVKPATSDAIMADADADPRDYGLRANQVYGYANGIQCHNAAVGAVSTVSRTLTSTGTVYVADASRFPSSGTVRIGNEQVSYTVLGAAAGDEGYLGFSSTNRGEAGTDAAAHRVGDLVTEIRESVFAVAGHPMDSVDYVYVINPADGKQVKANYYDIDLADTGSELRKPDGSAVTWTSIRISAADMDSFYNQLEFPQPEVEAQTTPTTVVSVPTWSSVISNGTGEGYHAAPSDSDASTEGITVELDPTRNWMIEQHVDFDAAETGGYCVYWPSTTSLDDTNLISRWRLIVNATLFNDHPTATMYLRARIHGSPTSSGGPTDPTTVITLSETAGNSTHNDQAKTAWYTTTGDVTQDDFKMTASFWTGFHVFLYMACDSGTVGFGDIAWATGDWTGAVQIEFEFKKDVTRTIDVSSSTRTLHGDGIRVMCNGGGYTAPDNTYSAGYGFLLDQPQDIIRHMLVERAGLPSSVIDEASWSNAESEFTPLSSGIAFSPDNIDWATFVVSGETAPGEMNELTPFLGEYDRSVNAAETPPVYKMHSETGVAPGTRDILICYFSAGSLPAVAVTHYQTYGEFYWDGDNHSGSNDAHMHIVAVKPDNTKGQIVGTESTAGGPYTTYSQGSPLAWVGDIDEWEIVSTSPTWDGARMVMGFAHETASDEYDPSEFFQVDSSSGFMGIRFTNSAWSGTQLGYVESDIGATFEQALSRVLFESRSQLVRVETATGTEYRWLVATKTADGAYGYTLNGDALTRWTKAVSNTRDIKNVYTAWRFFYNINKALQVSTSARSTEELYKGMQAADADTADFAGITTAEVDAVEEATGRLPHSGVYMSVVTGDDMVDNVGGFYISESLRHDAAIAEMFSLPWSEAYTLQIGDIRMVQLPWWPAAKKLRILKVKRSFATGLADVTGIEVL